MPRGAARPGLPARTTSRSSSSTRLDRPHAGDRRAPRRRPGARQPAADRRGRQGGRSPRGRHDLICMVDSDNVVVGRDWLAGWWRRSTTPRSSRREALRWDYRREDHFINRYQALTGINDPLALFIGNYDRWSELTGAGPTTRTAPSSATGGSASSSTREYVPTMGANGYIVRRAALRRRAGRRLLLRHRLRLRPRAARRARRSRASTSRSATTSATRSQRFYLKTRRRTDDFYYFSPRAGAAIRGRRGSVRASPNSCSRRVLVVPLLGQVARGCAQEPDPAWLFHVPACWITLAVYAPARSVGGSRRRCSTARAGASDVPGLRLGGEPRRVPGAGLVSAGQLRDVPLPRVRAVWLALPGPAPVAAGARDGALWLPRRRRRAGLDRAARRTARRAARPPRSSRPPTTRGRSSRSDAATASSSTGSVRAAGAASCVASSRTQAPHGRPPSGSACPSRRARRSRSRRPRAASGRS